MESDYYKIQLFLERSLFLLCRFYIFYSRTYGESLLPVPDAILIVDFRYTTG